DFAGGGGEQQGRSGCGESNTHVLLPFSSERVGVRLGFAAVAIRLAARKKRGWRAFLLHPARLAATLGRKLPLRLPRIFLSYTPPGGYSWRAFRFRLGGKYMGPPQFPDMLPPDALAAVDPQAEEPAIPFTPVPRQRQRRSGWTDQRQRAFISALAKCGSVSAAAKSIGMTARSAYRLLDADGADEFARAWD